MDLKRLKTFIRVARTLNLSEAARQIHRTQSSVTEQMQALEADLGVALFDRSNRKLALTAAGACLLGYADRLIDLADAARDAVLAAGGVACQTLDVGGIETIAAAFLPDVVARLAVTHPDVGVRVAVAATSALHAGVRDGTLDAAFFFGMCAPDDGVVCSVIAREPLVLIVPPGHLLAARARRSRRHRARALPRDGAGMRLSQDVRDGVSIPRGRAAAHRRRIRQRGGDRGSRGARPGLRHRAAHGAVDPRRASGGRSPARRRRDGAGVDRVP
jgi:DNA-binding transcriptional LysR family regulator